MTRIVALLSFLMAARAADIEADSARGARLFETLSCVQCHSINGKGGATAPDLGRLVDRNFTPSGLAATMWNHAPTMWSAMRARDVRPGDIGAQEARDLFAYFYSARYFEKPGDAARGKLAFTQRGCANCHGITEPARPGIKPVAQWEIVGDPNVLAEAMWNHRSYMLERSAQDRTRWPELSAQDLTDILVYVRNLPNPPSRRGVYLIGDGRDGDAVFNSKGCPMCHDTSADFGNRIKGRTLTEIAAAMWNHAPKMAAAGAPPVQFAPGEMRQLLGYTWARQFFVEGGTVRAGRRVFESRHCGTCHNAASSGAPKLRGVQFSSPVMVSVLWRHGPQMLEMKSKHVEWPRFDGAQMRDLISYLNAEAK